MFKVKRLAAALLSTLCLVTPTSAVPPPYEVTLGRVRQFLSATGFKGSIRSVAPIPAEPSDGWYLEFELLDSGGHVCARGTASRLVARNVKLSIGGDYSSEARRRKLAGHAESRLTEEARSRWRAALAASERTWEKAISDLCEIQALGGTADFDASLFAWRIRYVRAGGPQSPIDWLYVDPFSLRPFEVNCRREEWELPLSRESSPPGSAGTVPTPDARR
ncbi:hypothetical protein LLG88_03445 [bacterium]|nr:hypothetical protein [bacterium]